MWEGEYCWVRWGEENVMWEKALVGQNLHLYLLLFIIIYIYIYMSVYQPSRPPPQAKKGPIDTSNRRASKKGPIDNSEIRAYVAAQSAFYMEEKNTAQRPGPSGDHDQGHCRWCAATKAAIFPPKKLEKSSGWSSGSSSAYLKWASN